MHLTNSVSESLKHKHLSSNLSCKSTINLYLLIFYVKKPNFFRHVFLLVRKAAFLRRLEKALFQLAGKLLEAFLTYGPQVDVEKPGLRSKRPVTVGAAEVRRAPHFVQRLVALGRRQVAHEADESEELLEVRLAVSVAVLLVVLAAEERLLAVCAHEVLNVPLLSKRAGHARVFDGSPAGCAHRGDHLVVTLETVHLAVDLAPFARELHAAFNAVEVIRVVHFAISSQWFLVDYLVALCA